MGSDLAGGADQAAVPVAADLKPTEDLLHLFEPQSSIELARGWKVLEDIMTIHGGTCLQLQLLHSQQLTGSRLLPVVELGVLRLLQVLLRGRAP